MTTDSQSSAFDERRVGRALAFGIPALTFTLAVALSVILGLAMGILVLVAGGLLGVIALLWGSLRVLSGDAPLSPELEALENASHGVDALASRKKMLLRAIKDLDNEKAVGKIDEDDYAEVAQTYRAELKDVMHRIDASLEPHRVMAELVAKEHLAKIGLVDVGYRGIDASSLPVPGGDSPSKKESSREPTKTDARRLCPKCDASNEPDAKFCKECATSLARSDDEKEQLSDEA